MLFKWFKQKHNSRAARNGFNDLTLLHNDLIVAAGLTNQGRVRANNEDNFLLSSIPGQSGNQAIICAVADGMGGINFGEVASSIAIQVLQESSQTIDGRHPVWKEWLQEVAVKANLVVIQQGSKLNRKNDIIGSTLVAAVIYEHKAVVANIGDSRAYLLRDQKLQQITRDHSLVNILVEKGVIEPEESYTHPRRNELTQFLGKDSEVKADLFAIDLQVGDILLLCSDGLWGMVRDNQIVAIMQQAANVEHMVNLLVDAANIAGGQDNITVVVSRIIS